ncbi:hypothetical protein Ddc_19580 [Ditylenchus destructor]|nr:hypothetical protein Ddc_19580 [Ditylenchus destructor]
MFLFSSNSRKNECFLQSLIEKFYEIFSKRLQCYFEISVLSATLFLPVLNIPLPAVFQFTVVILTALLLNCEPDPLDDLSFQIFQVEFVPSAQYGNRFLADLDQNRLNLTRLTRPEKIAINRRLFGVTKEYIEQSGKMIRPDNSAVAARWTYLFEQDKLLQKESKGQSVSPRDKWDFRASFKGKGNLSVILAGNSHANQIANELAFTWSDRYSTLDVFTMGVCLPLDLQYGWPRYNEKLCLSYSKDHKTGGRLEARRLISQLLPFVGKIFLGASNLTFDNLVIAVEVEQHIWWGEGSRVGELNQPYQDHVQRNAAHWDCLRHIRCGKCVIVDWTDSFCDG